MFVLPDLKNTHVHEIELVCCYISIRLHCMAAISTHLYVYSLTTTPSDSPVHIYTISFIPFSVIITKYVNISRIDFIFFGSSIRTFYRALLRNRNEERKKSAFDSVIV